MHVTQLLAEHVVALRTRALPQAARASAMACLTDLLGAAIAGFHTPLAMRTRRAAATLYAPGTSPVWFAGTLLNAAGAALCNSAAASALDIDDGNRPARGHPGAAVIPAALAVAAEVNAAADELLAAIVAGYEIGVRVATARNAAPTTVSRQSGRWTGYAAVAAAGCLRRTPPDVLAQAFAIAGVSAPNQEANGSSGYSKLTGNDVKEGIAWSTAGGIAALHFAEAGLTGPLDLLDHESHFARAPLVDGLDGLGAHHAIEQTYFKLYACCRYNHCAIDAFLSVLAAHRIAPGEIEAVAVHTFGWALQLGNKVEPQNLIDVQYSVPYCMAIAAMAGAQALAPIESSVLQRADLTALARRITLHKDAALDAQFPARTLARVTVKTADRVYESPVSGPRGEASQPLSPAELREKFLAVTRVAMSAPQQQTLLDAIARLSQGDSAPLFHALAAPIGNNS